MKFLKEFRNRNNMIIQLMVLLIISVSAIVNLIVDFAHDVHSWNVVIPTAFMIGVVIYSLIKGKYLIALVALLFLGSYASDLIWLIRGIHNWNIPSFGEFSRLFINSLIAIYIILTTLSYLTEPIYFSKKINKLVLLLTIVTAGFLYVATGAALGITAVVVGMIPVLLAIAFKSQISAIILMIATTIGIPLTFLWRVSYFGTNLLTTYDWVINILSFLVVTAQIYVLVDAVIKKIDEPEVNQLYN